MFYLDPELLVKLVGFGGFLWLGLFIVSRATRQTYLTIVGMLGLLAMACYLFSSTLIGNNTTGLEVEGGTLLARAFWWTDLLPTAFWFHITMLIRREVVNKPPFNRVVGLVYAIAAFLSLVGTFSDAFLDYTHSFWLPGNHVYTGVSTSYILIVLYLLLINGASFYILLKSWLMARHQTTSRQTGLNGQLRLLVVGGFLFMVGGAWLALNFYFKFNLYDLWGNAFLLIGLILIGYGVAHFCLLVEGQDIRRDFIYSLTLNALVCLVYVTGLALTGAYSTLNALVVVGLAVISHTTFDFFRGQWGRFFFNHREQLARSEAWAYATAIASQPAPVQELEQAITLNTPVPTKVENVDSSEIEAGKAEVNPAGSSQPEFSQKKFNDLVRKAITDLKNPPQMIKSPLLSLVTIEAHLRESDLEDNRLNRVAILRGWLIQLIENLRPAGSEASGTGEAWRFYNVLYYPYVREISRKGALVELRRYQHDRRQNNRHEAPGDIERTLEWLVEIEEDTFYKWQRKASDTIAAIIREQELKQPAIQTEALLTREF